MEAYGKDHYLHRIQSFTCPGIAISPLKTLNKPTFCIYCSLNSMRVCTSLSLSMSLMSPQSLPGFDPFSISSCLMANLSVGLNLGTWLTPSFLTDYMQYFISASFITNVKPSNVSILECSATCFSSVCKASADILHLIECSPSVTLSPFSLKE